MAKLSFETLSFEQNKDSVEITFLKLFSFEIPNRAVLDIGKFSVGENYIDFKDVEEISTRNMFSMLLSKGFENLKTKSTGKKAVYVHKGSGIPLIGNVAFGIVDRNTNIIEVKPITVCNLKCVYCSVNDDMRPVDFVVEADYLVEEFRKIAEYKGCKELEVHIGGQAEPLFYADLAHLIRELKSLEYVKEISIDTNCTMLSKAKVDELVDAGMTRFNLSINSMDEKLAEKIAGAPYSLKKVLETAEYISKKCDLIIAPVWVQGLNDSEMPKIIEFAKKLAKTSTRRVILGIQNFLCYRHGRNPAKQMDWDEFRQKLEELEKQHDARLILDFKKDFNIMPTKPLPKPFRKGQKIDAVIVCEGRLAGEKIAAAQERSISLQNCSKMPGSKVKIRITGAKHSIYYGALA